MAPSTPQASSVSSRLLSMKFMQRAAADTPPSSVESSSKRRKLSQASPAASPADDPFSQARVRAAMEEVESKRAAAVERRAAEMQEARWVLDAPAVSSGGKKPLNVVYVGYGDIDRAERGEDDEDDEGEDKVQSGRRITGNYKRKEDKEEARPWVPPSNGVDAFQLTVSQTRSADDSDSEDETSDSEDGTPRKKKRKNGDAADKRKKEVKLSRLVSISGGGGGGSGGGAGGGSAKGMKCFGCGGTGHKASSSECPKNRGAKKRRAG